MEITPVVLFSANTPGDTERPKNSKSVEVIMNETEKSMHKGLHGQREKRGNSFVFTLPYTVVG